MPTRGQIRAISGPVILWALHFIAVYAVLSAACAPRMVLDYGTARLVVAGLTVIAAPLAALPLFTGARRDPDLARAATWSAIISTTAILVNALPVAFMTSCGG